jgi:hypothetical protein
MSLVEVMKGGVNGLLQCGKEQRLAVDGSPG